MSDAEFGERVRDHLARRHAWRLRRITETVEDIWSFTPSPVDDYEQWIRTLARRSRDKAALITNDWADEMHRVPRHDRPAALARIAELVDPATLNGILSVWWPELEATHRLGHDTVIRLFRRAGYVSDNYHVAASPMSEMTIFRGTDRPDMGAARGVSWTTDPDTARWYANRFNTGAAGSFGWVWRAIVDAEDVLGQLWSHGEREVIVDARRLRELTLFELVSAGVLEK